MATGALDTNGVWQYGEDDVEPTFSDLLNLLASSTSDAIAAHYASLAARLSLLESNTGWVSLSAALATGTGGAALFTASSGFAITKVGNRVTMRGRVDPVSGSNWGAADSSVTVIPANGIPAQFRPPQSQAFQGSSNNAATTFRVAFGQDGSLAVRCSTANYTGSCWFSCVDMPVNT